MKSEEPVVLISGANGYLASNLIQKLLKKECSILALSHNPKETGGLFGEDNLITAKYDFQNPRKLKDIFTSCDVFVNFAWREVRGSQRENKDLQFENAEAAIKLAREAVEIGAKRVIQIGSLAEYGEYEGRLSEETPSDPITEYGKAKLYCAGEIRKLCEEKNVKFIELRMGSVYGGNKDNSILKRISDAIKRGDSVAMTTECSQDWEFVHIENVEDILVKSIFNEDVPTGVYNVSTGETKPLKEFLSEYADHIGRRNAISYGNQKNGLGCYAINTDTKKLRATFKIDPFKRFEDGIKNE